MIYCERLGVVMMGGKEAWNKCTSSKWVEMSNDELMGCEKIWNSNDVMFMGYGEIGNYIGM